MEQRQDLIVKTIKTMLYYTPKKLFKLVTWMPVTYELINSVIVMQLFSGFLWILPQDNFVLS